MSRLSKYIRDRYSKNGEAADAIIRRWLGKWTNEIMEIAVKAVKLAELADERGEWKREIVTAIIRGALNKYDINLPDRAINYIVERVLAVLDNLFDEDAAEPIDQTPIDNTDPDPEPVEPVPVPPEPPPALYEVIYYTEPQWELYTRGDKVYVDNHNHPTRWYVVPGMYKIPVMLPTILDPRPWKVIP